MLPNDSIERFIKAQDSPFNGYEVALEEIRRGSKQSHWMWYIFPQLRSLGRSETAFYYGISDRCEAEAYLAHPILAQRIRVICEALIEHYDKPIEQIMGSVDALKLRSSMTLFDALICHDIFERVLDTFYDGKRCQHTLDAVMPY